MNRISQYIEKNQDSVIEAMIAGLREDYMNNLTETRVFIALYHKNHSDLDFEIIRNLKGERTRIENGIIRWTDIKNRTHSRRSKGDTDES